MLDPLRLASGATVITVPGFHNSGPGHWQTLWEQRRPDTRRADLGSWDAPQRTSWVARLDDCVRRARGPIFLAAHSLGCLAVAWWVQLIERVSGPPVAGALLVSPADLDRRDTPAELESFAPVPPARLPFPSILVASADDPWITLNRARGIAADWGSEFIDAGARGHLNADSGLGDWPEGEALLGRLIATSGSRFEPRCGRATAAHSPDPPPKGCP